mgnify:CR=1 FL=1|tara:strand:+ start:397 stop:1551 length:1155 start_codon:yes stop_codon:yes gene_type:complete
MLLLLVLSNRFINDFSFRSIIIPESDDVEDSAKNAKDTVKILSFIRSLILADSLLIFTSISIFLNAVNFVNEYMYKILFSLFLTSISIILSILIGYLFPTKALTWFILPVKIIKLLALKIADLISQNKTVNGKEKMENDASEQLEVFEAAGLSVDIEEMKMIKGILKMDVVRVREIMKPRVDLITIDISEKLNDVADLMSSSGYSKLPVIDQSIDNVKGIIYAKDALKIHNGTMPKIDEIIRPAIFVPESQNLEQLLSEFQDKRTRIAVVMDEHGGVSGLVTVTDLIEEIVGELGDEFDQPDPSLFKINENDLIVDAKVSVSDLNEEIGTSIAIDGYDTIGGLVYKELGRMPSVGDTVNFEDIEITIQSTIGRRIGKLRIRILK